MQPQSQDSDDLLASNSQYRRFGAAQGRHLLDLQKKALRGLSTRWRKLSDSFAFDSLDLSQKIQTLQQSFRNEAKELSTHHKQQLHDLQTKWDDQIDRSLSVAELATLEKARWEQQTLKNLKLKRKDAEAKLDSDLAHSRSRIDSELEKGRQAARQMRDQAVAKLDTEQESLEEITNDLREWVTLKTGSSTVQGIDENSAPPRSLSHIDSLAAMAKEYEDVKKKFLEKKLLLQTNKTAAAVNVPLLIVIGIASGGIAFLIASAIKASPLILGIGTLLSAILLPIVVYIALLPLVARSIRSSLNAVFEEAQALSLLLQRGRAIAEAMLKRELTRLEEASQLDLEQAIQKHEQLLQQIQADYQSNKTATVESAVGEKANFRRQRIESLELINREYPLKITHLKAEQLKDSNRLQREAQATLDSLNSAFRDSQRFFSDRWIQGVHCLRKIGQEAESQIRQRFPDWNSETFTNAAWTRQDSSLAFPVARFKVSQKIPDDHPAKQRQNEFQMLVNLASALEQIGQLPMTYDLIGSGGLILRSRDPESREHVHSTIRNLVLRAVTALPAGMLQVTVIDPEGLGKKYSWLMHLADIDPELVNHRVWTQPIHIANQLALTTRHIEDVIQQSLRNQYRNLYDYNQKAGPMAIPYRIIVWSGFPFGLDDSSWQSICSILASGSKCGVGMLIDWPSSIQWPTFAEREKLSEFAVIGDVSKNQSGQFELAIAVPEISSFPATLESPPNDSTVAAIMENHLVAASNVGKRIVPFSSIVSLAEAGQFRKSADGLEIPIGISDSGRIQSVSLGEGTSQHVLIAGKTGSGKSSLLHTMISSAAMEYSPNELRLVLLDFKKGVEFQVYSELSLSHADIIGIESRREFGLSTLEYLDRVLSARGEAFRQFGVQDLPSLRRKFPDEMMPRILIVIDEFQELFVEDDKISQQAAMLMDRIVRQGRSFGMHLVLASQTLGGAYSLPRTTLAQMAVRIALQCDSADAMLILSEDNTAAERLRHSGQGIYNTAGGRLEANQNFQVAFLPKEEQVQRLKTLPIVSIPYSPTINSIGRRIVFEGHKLATWDIRNLEHSLPQFDSKKGVFWPLGDSVSIEPPVVRNLAAAPGRNAMIVSNHEDLVASLVASFIKVNGSVSPSTTNEQPPRILLIDGSRSDDRAVKQVLDAATELSSCVIIGPKELERTFIDLASELTRRLTDPHTQHPQWIVFILNIAKFRELKREEDYSFGSGEDATIKPDAILAKLLSDGPGSGIHLCIWADAVATLNRWLSRGSLRDIEIRILGQMSANDSNLLIDNNQANRLDRTVMLVHDDADGKFTKFRPFIVDSVLKSENDGSN